MSTWSLDDILKSAFTQVTLDFTKDQFGDQNPKKIIGYLIDDTISFDSDSQWEELGSSLSDLLSKVTSVFPTPGNLFAQALGNIGNTLTQVASLGMKAVGLGPQPEIGSIVAWNGASRPAWDIGLLFVHAKNGEDKPEEKVRVLNSRCYPKFIKAGITLMRTPMGYNPIDAMAADYTSGAASSLKGTCVLTIGKWFKAPGLVVTGSSFEFSKECAKDGSPIYAQGKIQVQTYRMISYREYMDYFINVGGGGGDGTEQNDIGSLSELKPQKGSIKKLEKNAAGAVPDLAGNIKDLFTT